MVSLLSFPRLGRAFYDSLIASDMASDAALIATGQSLKRRRKSRDIWIARPIMEGAMFRCSRVSASNKC